MILLTLILASALIQPSPSLRVNQEKPAETNNQTTKNKTTPTQSEPPTTAPDTPKEEQNTPKKDNEGRDNPSYWHKVFSPDILPNWILMGVGIVGTIIAVITLLCIKSQFEDTRRALHWAKRSAIAAKKSADAAFLNARAIINTERAWLTVDFVAEGSDYALWVTNRGRTPAEIINYQFWIACPPIAERVFPENPPNTFIKPINTLLISGNLWDEDERFNMSQYFGSEWDAIICGNKTGLIRIRINYKNSITKEPHETEVVYSYRASESKMVPLKWLNRYT
jgi:hypothetical protein